MDKNISFAVEQPTGDLTDEQIKKVAHEAVKAGALNWSGFEEDERGFYTVPTLSTYHYQFARAIERAAIAAHLARQAQAVPIPDHTAVSPFRQAIRAIMSVECPYNDHDPSERPKVHAWDMAMIEAIRAINRIVDAAPVAPAGAQNAEAIRNQATDRELLDFLDRWVAENKVEGWNEFHFAFDHSGTAREQIAEQIEIDRDALQTGSANPQKGGEHG